MSQQMIHSSKIHFYKRTTDEPYLRARLRRLGFGVVALTNLKIEKTASFAPTRLQNFIDYFYSTRTWYAHF